MKLTDTSPEMALWFGVLCQSTEDFEIGDKYAAAAARRWFYGERTGMGSFLWICNLFGMNATTFRDRLKEGDFLKTLLRGRAMLGYSDLTVTVEEAGA